MDNANTGNNIGGNEMNKLNVTELKEKQKKYKYGLSDRQRKAFNYLAKERGNLCITGQVGTGKSMVIDRYMQYAEEMKIKVIACTHSVYGILNKKKYSTADNMFYFNRNGLKGDELVLERFESIKPDVIIIDDIQEYANSDITDIIKIVKGINKDSRVKNPIRLIIVGDTVMFRANWGISLQSTGILDSFSMKIIELTVRKSEHTPKTFKTINDIRIKGVGSLDMIGILNQNKYNPDLNYGRDDFLPVHIFSETQDAETYNAEALEEDINTIGESKVYQAKDWKPYKNFIKTNDYKPAPLVLDIKVGAFVMLLADGIGYKAGDFGRVVAMNSDEQGDYIAVSILNNGNTVRVRKYTWEQRYYEIGEERVNTYEQFPMQLGYAIDISHSKGKLFDKGIIHYYSSFNIAMTKYELCTAISRVKNINEAYLDDRKKK